MSFPLEDYALIGDCELAALVCRTGSVDWLCWPRFDSDACLAALVGDARNGQWRLRPADPHPTVVRRYRPDTLVLETDFTTTTGAMRVIDFMPRRDGAPTLVRIAVGLGGTVEVETELRLRFGYGFVPPWIEAEQDGVIGRVGPDLVAFYADVPLQCRQSDVAATFTLREGERAAFVLRFGTSTASPPPRIDVEQALKETEAFWQDWIGDFDKPTDWPAAVRRSLITLKALINRTTGGIVAAPTASLPEIPGGEMNWDYRYCWLRDAAFTVTALLNAGYLAEAKEWRDWILRAIAGAPDRIQIMYRLDGARHLNEWTAHWLSGYRWSSPVRIGNDAAGQRQIDVYGELVDVLNLASRAGIERPEHGLRVEQAIIEHLETVWREPGHGIWELRGTPHHYVYSKIMAWVAVDRFLKGWQQRHDADREVICRMQALRTAIHEEVCREGYHPGLQSFVQHYGSQEIDASLLLIPLLGFLPVEDPRVTLTIRRVEQELMDEGLVHRTAAAADAGQGAFLACSCWLADCRSLQGRDREAREALERVLDVRNDVGLLSEEYNIRGGHLAGNFPQALSHLALVTTALGLSGPVLQRGGG